MITSQIFISFSCFLWFKRVSLSSSSLACHIHFQFSSNVFLLYPHTTQRILKNSRKFPRVVWHWSEFLLYPLKARPFLPSRKMTSINFSRRSQVFITSSICLGLFAIFFYDIRLSTSIFCWKSTRATLASLCVFLFSRVLIVSVYFFKLLKNFKTKELPWHSRKFSPRDVESMSSKQEKQNIVSCDSE